MAGALSIPLQQSTRAHWSRPQLAARAPWPTVGQQVGQVTDSYYPNANEAFLRPGRRISARPSAAVSKLLQKNSMRLPSGSWK
jgi:hypothetical protein